MRYRDCRRGNKAQEYITNAAIDLVPSVSHPSVYEKIRKLQYAAEVSKGEPESPLKDIAAEQEIRSLLEDETSEEIYKAMEIDHIFCSSVKEQRGREL